MFSLFQRKKAPPTPVIPFSSSSTAPDGWLPPEPAASLLATPRRQRLLEQVWQRTSLSRRQFDTLYQAPVERFAELAQHFPASENHHHAWPGGLLDHVLETVAYALKLRQPHLLPLGAAPETQAVQADAWTAAMAYAALLHDLGKLAVDLDVEQADGSCWHPWHGPLAQHYRFRYRPAREYRLHGAATGLLCRQILPREGLDWLCAFPDPWAALLYALAGQYEHAGILGELVRQADQASVAQALGGDPARALAAPRHALQRKLLDGLRYLVREELKLNQPQASDGWLTEDTLWLVSKTVSDRLRAHLLAQGLDGIPSGNPAVFNVLQEHGIVQSNADGKAIWRAAINSASGWSHAFTFLKLAPALIWEANERPAPFDGTVTVEQAVQPESCGDPADDEAAGAAPSVEPTVILPAGSDVVGDPLLDWLTTVAAPSSHGSSASMPRCTEEEMTGDTPGTVAGTEKPATASAEEALLSGEHFMDWLRIGIQTRKLIINDARALVHTVAGTAYLVSPGLFQRYAQEYPETARLARQDDMTDWQWVQKRFEKQLLHRKRENGLNIWTCAVKGPRKSRRLHGYLLENPRLLFDEVPPDNPYLEIA